MNAPFYLSLLFAVVLVDGACPLAAQAISVASPDSSGAALINPALEKPSPSISTPSATSPLQPLLIFQESDIKFSLNQLMNTLRDNRHEGWVLAAYPDPKTSRPLIGAGFSLDVPAREHAQRDPGNPNLFLEPSSAELWEAAGLEPPQLQSMLEQYDRELSAWKKKKFRRKIRTHDLFPQISEEDATRLLRISAIQAVHNARAYCRYFDRLTGPQQMALSQMVFQMGVNLEQFTQFLWAINNPPEFPYLAHTPNAAPESNDPQLVAAALTENSDVAYWKSVQATLIQSDWARRYSTRAIAVIAMFDPGYESAPAAAEANVRAQVHPLHKKRSHAPAVRSASAHKKASAHHSHKS